MNEQNSTHIMESGNVKKTLFSLGIPAMVAMMISVVYNFVDTMFIGRLDSTAAMGAVTIAYPVFMIISALGQFVGIGASSYVARMLGNKRKDLADRTASIAVLLSFAIAILTTGVGLLALKNILEFMGASPTVLPEGIKYTKWLLIGSIFTLLNMCLSSLIRAEGNAKISMISLIIGAVINIILDPLFMFTFKGGIAGASLATVVGQMCSTIYLALYYVRGKGEIKISLRKIFEKGDGTIYVEIFKIGAPIFLMQFLLSIASSILNTTAMPFGDAAVAAMGVANRVYTLPLYLISGFIQGFQPFVAYNYGAKLYTRFNEAISFTLKLLIGGSLIFTVTFVAFPEFFARLFTQDMEVIGLACNALTAMSILFPFIACLLVVIAIFQGMGKAKEAAIISISRQGLFFIPVALILPSVFNAAGEQLGWIMQLFPTQMPHGLYGVMLTQPLADCMAAMLALVISIKPLRQLKKLESSAAEEKACIDENHSTVHHAS